MKKNLNLKKRRDEWTSCRSKFKSMPSKREMPQKRDAHVLLCKNANSTEMSDKVSWSSDSSAISMKSVE
jgi:hypothetical protein